MSSAAVQDFEACQRLQEALLVLKLLAQGETDVAAGRTIPQERVFEDVRSRLTASK